MDDKGMICLLSTMPRSLFGLQGTILKEESVHRLHYHNSWNASLIKKEDLVAQLGAIPVEVYVWEGDEPIPKWCKDENGTLICRVTMQMLS